MINVCDYKNEYLQISEASRIILFPRVTVMLLRSLPDLVMLISTSS